MSLVRVQDRVAPAEELRAAKYVIQSGNESCRRPTSQGFWRNLRAVPYVGIAQKSLGGIRRTQLRIRQVAAAELHLDYGKSSTELSSMMTVVLPLMTGFRGRWQVRLLKEVTPARGGGRPRRRGNGFVQSRHLTRRATRSTTG